MTSLTRSMRDRRATTIAVSVVAGLLLAGCGGKTSPHAIAPDTTSTGAGTPAPRIDRADWVNVIDDLDCSPINRGIEVVSQDYADVTGDGVKDAFVWAMCVHSTSSWPQQLEVFDGASGGSHPRRLTVLVPAVDNLRAEGLSFSGRTVTMHALGYAEQDPTCCPSLEVTQTFTWNGSRFVPGERNVTSPTP